MKLVTENLGFFFKIRLIFSSVLDIEEILEDIYAHYDETERDNTRGRYAHVQLKNRKHKKVNGSAKGKPYLAEINPLAQKKTNKAEAAAVKLGDISFF